MSKPLGNKNLEEKPLSNNHQDNQWVYDFDEKDGRDNLRNIGYTLEEAISDIVDNSIDAQATKIYIEYHFRDDNNEGYVAIIDNGIGMDKASLTNAFSYKKNRTAESNRLGFFGYGLKTATSSQCDKLSILTKQRNTEILAGTVYFNNDDKTIHREFDDPNNLSTAFNFQSERISLPFQFNNGTIVLWSEMNERLGKTLRKIDNVNNYFDINTRIKNHLSLTFCELIKKGKIEIYVGRNTWDKKPIEHFDPFLVSERDTIELPSEEFYVEDFEGNIEVQPYVVPDIRSLPEEKREKITSFYSWNEMQGIYIYRNQRLLSFGKWHGLRYKNQILKESSDKYRNLRIKVLFNKLKNLEKLNLTINKSKMNLPAEIEEKLTLKLARIIDGYSKHTNISKIKRVFLYKGKDQSIWKKNFNENLEIDKKHPIIKDLIKDEKFGQQFKQLISILNQQQKEHNLINIVLKFNEPNYSNDEVLLSQIQDQYMQLNELKIFEEKEIIDILVSLFSDSKKVDSEYIKRKIIDNE